jgi:hypothetical protein
LISATLTWLLEKGQEGKDYHILAPPIIQLHYHPYQPT